MDYWIKHKNNLQIYKTKTNKTFCILHIIFIDLIKIFSVTQIYLGSWKNPHFFTERSKNKLSYGSEITKKPTVTTYFEVISDHQNGDFHQLTGGYTILALEET